MTEKLGYECLKCGLKSDIKKDFKITKRNVVCKCGGSVYPMDILKGVKWGYNNGS